MLVAQQIALDPNNKQRTLMAKSAGVARFAYNWALARWKILYQQGEKPNEGRLRRDLNGIKKDEFPWMLEVSKNAPQQAIKNLGTSFNRFFKKLGAYPRFKKKGVRDSFRADNGPAQIGADAVEVTGRKIRLAKIGWIRMRENVRLKGQIKSATVWLKAGRWYVSLVIEVDEEKLRPQTNTENQGVVGVDLGIKTLATLSNGEIYISPRPLRLLLKRLQKLSRQFLRKKKGSRNRRKWQLKLACLHGRIADIRSDFLHKLTHYLSRTFSHIVIEDLNVTGMMRNHSLARAIADMGFYEFRRQLQYKCQWQRVKLSIADCWFPSSKLCSQCSHKLKTLELSCRHWQCPNCGAEHDRDLNAALNLRNLAASSAVSACGEESAGRRPRVAVKLASMKQEPNIRPVDQV